MIPPTGPCGRWALYQKNTSVLLGEQAVSKAAPRGSNPRARACRRGSTEKGAGLVCVVGRRAVDAGANPVVGSDGDVCPGGVVDRMGPSEGPGPGSTPGRDTLWPVKDYRPALGRRPSAVLGCWFDSWTGYMPCECAGFARQPSKLQDEVRLLGGALVIDIYRCPRSVADSHATLRRSRTRFDSWRGHLTI